MPIDYVAIGYILLGVVITGVSAGVASYINGYWQNRNVKIEYKIKRRLELEKIIYERKLNRIDDKLAEQSCKIAFIEKQYYVKSKIFEYHKLVQGELQSMPQYTEIIDRELMNNLNYYNIIPGSLNDVRKIFFHMSKDEQIAILDNLTIKLQERNLIDYNEYMKKLNPKGWSYLLKNRKTLQSILELDGYLDGLIDEYEPFEIDTVKKSVQSDQSKISKAIWIEIHNEMKK